jgi:hypothetical protein
LHDEVCSFHLLSAPDPNKKQMNNDEHPTPPQKDRRNVPLTQLKAADFLVDLVGAA